MCLLTFPRFVAPYKRCPGVKKKTKNMQVVLIIERTFSLADFCCLQRSLCSFVGMNGLSFAFKNAEDTSTQKFRRTVFFFNLL